MQEPPEPEAPGLEAPEPESALELQAVLEPGAAIIRMSTAIDACAREARTASRLSTAQIRILRLAVPGCSLGVIMELLDIPKSTAASLVDRLAVSGLIGKTTDGNDRRRQILRATPGGVRRLARFDARLAMRVEQLLDVVPPSRRERLTALLSRIPDTTVADSLFAPDASA